MSFSKELKKRDETETRTSFDYVKFTPDYRVVLRMLNGEARQVYKHFIPQANERRGWSVVCPGRDVCPMETSVEDLDWNDEARKEKQARRRFIVNVLDRTPYTVCQSCGTNTPGKTCVNCKKSLSGHDFAPLNKVKIMEQGPQLFNEKLNAVEQMQLDELNKEITEYDITFSTQGNGRERRINAVPQPAVEFKDDWLLDPETKEPQKLYDLDLLAEPASIAEVNAALEGATAQELLRIRNPE